jgi:general secretion pathway protein M
MKNALARFQAWFAQLAPRERWMVVAAAIVVAITLLYLAVWEPLVNAQQRRSLALQEARALASRIEQLAGQTQGARGPAVNLGVSVLSAVDQSARAGALDKPPSRIQPEGEREVKVWIDGVSFDALLRWLQSLQTGYGISVQSAELERGAAPGQVNAQLSLVRQ